MQRVVNMEKLQFEVLGASVIHIQMDRTRDDVMASEQCNKSEK